MVAGGTLVAKPNTVGTGTSRKVRGVSTRCNHLGGKAPHLVVAQDGNDTIPWRRDVREIKAAELARLHITAACERHSCAWELLLTTAIRAARVLDVGICSKEDVQARLVPVAVLVFPCGDLQPSGRGGGGGRCRYAYVRSEDVA
eukprot:352421-Chlamydomonas_euryale.AAC.15